MEIKNIQEVRFLFYVNLINEAVKHDENVRVRKRAGHMTSVRPYHICLTLANPPS